MTREFLALSSKVMRVGSDTLYDPFIQRILQNKPSFLTKIRRPWMLCLALELCQTSQKMMSMRRNHFWPSWLCFSNTRQRSSKSYFWHAYELRLEACATFCLLLSALHLSTKKGLKTSFKHRDQLYHTLKSCWNICSFWLETLCQGQKNSEANFCFLRKNGCFFRPQG